MNAFSQQNGIAFRGYAVLLFYVFGYINKSGDKKVKKIVRISLFVIDRIYLYILLLC